MTNPNRKVRRRGSPYPSGLSPRTTRVKRAFHHPGPSWLLLTAYGLLLFIQSALPSPHIGPELTGTDKVLHLAAYAVMGFLACRAFATWPRLRNPIILYMAGFLFAVLFGLSDEWHQSFVPARTADGWDLVADGIGALLGVGIFGWCYRRGATRGTTSLVDKRPRIL